MERGAFVAEYFARGASLLRRFGHNKLDKNNKLRVCLTFAGAQFKQLVHDLERWYAFFTTRPLVTSKHIQPDGPYVFRFESFVVL